MINKINPEIYLKIYRKYNLKAILRVSTKTIPINEPPTSELL